MQGLNLLVITVLFVIQIGYCVAWIKSDRILIFNIIKLFLMLPAKVLYIVIAKEFAVR
jgi:hypothetical protein